MRKALAWLAKFIACMFAILFVVVTVAALLMFNVERQIFDAGLYKRTLAEQHFYERFPALAAEQIMAMANYTGPGTERMTDSPELEACLKQALGVEVFDALAGFQRQPTRAEAEQMRPCLALYAGAQDEEPGEGGPPPYFENLTQADWEVLLSSLIPTTWLQTQAESVIDQAVASLEPLGSDAPAPSIKISMAGLKEHIGGGAGIEAALQLARAQPPCTAAQLALVDSAVENLPHCRPPEEILTAITPQIEKIVNEAVADIPDEIDLGQTPKGEGESGVVAPREGGGLPNLMRLVRWPARLSPLVSLVLLLLVTLFGVRSRRGLLRWWGIPFLVVGLIGVGLAVAALAAMNWTIATYMADKIPPNIGAGLAQAGLEMGRSVVWTLATWIGVEAALIGLLGLVLLLRARKVSRASASNDYGVTAGDLVLKDG